MKKLDRNLVGQKFGRLTVIEDMGRNPHSQKLWKCICDCGTECIKYECNLLSGNTYSCGCLKRELSHNKKVQAKNQSLCFPCKVPVGECAWCMSTPEQRERYTEWDGMTIKPKNVHDNQTKIDRKYTVYIVQECVYAR